MSAPIAAWSTPLSSRSPDSGGARGKSKSLIAIHFFCGSSHIRSMIRMSREPALLEQLVSSQHRRLGNAVLAAQRQYADTGAFPELFSIYHLFGDPALTLRSAHCSRALTSGGLTASRYFKISRLERFPSGKTVTV